MDLFRTDYLQLLVNKARDRYIPKPFSLAKSVPEKTVSLVDLLSLYQNELAEDYAVFALLADAGFYLWQASFTQDMKLIDAINQSDAFNQFLIIIQKIMGIDIIGRLQVSFSNDHFLLDIDELDIRAFEQNDVRFKLDDPKFLLDRDPFLRRGSTVITYENIDYARALLARTYKFFSFATFNNVLGSLSALFGFENTDIKINVDKPNKHLALEFKLENSSRNTRGFIINSLELKGSDGEILWSKPFGFSYSVYFDQGDLTNGNN